MKIRIPDDLQSLLVPLADIRLDPANANEHDDAGIQDIVMSIAEFGFDQPVLLRQDGQLIAGEGRYLAAQSLGMEAIPAVRTPLNSIDATRRGIGDNVIARKSKLNEEKLAALLTSLRNEDEKLLKGTGYDDKAVEGLLAEIAKNGPQAVGEDKGPQVDRAAELQAQWGTALGQVWELGEHRLAVGDCTDRAVVEAVMRGEKAHMAWTDPPYGVAVGDKNKFLNSISRSNRVEENLVNDTLDEAGLAALLAAAFDNAVAVSTAGAAWYVAAPAGPLHPLFGQALKDRGIWRQTIHWVKNNATFAPLGVDYHWQEESIFYGWVPGAAHRFFGGRTQTTVWNIDRPTKSPEHPTMKPVELVERAINNSSLSGEIVFDPFCGSGTTLVACENLGRKGRGIEIASGYAAVILQRLADMGLEPRLLT